MSIDLDWSSLDYDLTQSVTRFLSEAFASAPRPDFIGPLAVESFSFGDCEPRLELVDIRDVDREFDHAPEPPPVLVPLSRTRTRSRSPHPHPHAHSDSYDPPFSPTPSLRSLLDDPAGQSSAPSPSFQVHVRLTYSGTLSLSVATSLLINYPSPEFMSLPLALTVTDLALDTTLIVAFEGSTRSVHLSLLDPDPTASRKESPGNRILKSAQVESEVGQSGKHVLKNVGKVEKFVLDVARKTLENEIVFPNFQTILF